MLSFLAFPFALRPVVNPLVRTGAEVAGAVADVIKLGKKEVLIISGALAHECYNEPVLEEAINRALRRGVEFRVIVGPDIDQESKFAVGKLKGSIHQVQECPQFHIVVADRKHIRFVREHPAGAKSRPNMVVYDVPEAASCLADYFETLWNMGRN